MFVSFHYLTLALDLIILVKSQLLKLLIEMRDTQVHQSDSRISSDPTEN
jgi:hypothetical protein